MSQYQPRHSTNPPFMPTSPFPAPQSQYPPPAPWSPHFAASTPRNSRLALAGFIVAGTLWLFALPSIIFPDLIGLDLLFVWPPALGLSIAGYVVARRGGFGLQKLALAGTWMAGGWMAVLLLAMLLVALASI